MKYFMLFAGMSKMRIFEFRTVSGKVHIVSI